jgi:hypothetical protein
LSSACEAITIPVYANVAITLLFRSKGIFQAVTRAITNSHCSSKHPNSDIGADSFTEEGIKKEEKKEAPIVVLYTINKRRMNRRNKRAKILVRAAQC